MRRSSAARETVPSPKARDGAPRDAGDPQGADNLKKIVYKTGLRHRGGYVGRVRPTERIYSIAVIRFQLTTWADNMPLFGDKSR